jgi:type II secretory pathway pseudopilin PulG
MKSRRESGFAMLFVFVLAAAIAITLYIEVPRIAFESQRAREQMAIDRALQYQRAIQLFYRKYRLYPQTLDDLETTRNIRFLRHRYKDPLTGKEFRLLHVGPAGQLTDSLVQPAAPLPGSSGGSGPNSAQGSSTPSSASNSAQTANPADPNNPNAQTFDPLNMAARRPSDRIAGQGGPGGVAGDQPPPDPDPNPPPQPVQQPTPDPNQPAQPNQPLQPVQPVLPGQPGIPGQPVQQPTDPNQPNQPNQPQDPSQPQPPGQPQFPVQPQFPGQPMPAAPTGVAPGPAPISPFVPNANVNGPAGMMNPAAGATASAGSNPQANTAAGLIQGLLTTARQPPASIAGFTTGNTGGIAGVASTAEGKGIHVVNDRTKYKEWEFVYDIKKDKTVVGAAGVAQQQQIQQQMQPSTGASGSSPFGSSPFGSSTSNSTPASPSAAPSAPTTPPPQ